MWIAPGTRLGQYEIVAALAAGAMGEVYSAIDSRLNRRVALKVLPPAVADDPDRRVRFEREARSASALNHPNIVTIYDIYDVGEEWPRPLHRHGVRRGTHGAHDHPVGADEPVDGCADCGSSRRRTRQGG
jgi:hypothetical protein